MLATYILPNALPPQLQDGVHLRHTCPCQCGQRIMDYALIIIIILQGIYGKDFISTTFQTSSSNQIQMNQMFMCVFLNRPFIKLFVNSSQKLS